LRVVSEHAVCVFSMTGDPLPSSLECLLYRQYNTAVVDKNIQSKTVSFTHMFMMIFSAFDPVDTTTRLTNMIRFPLTDVKLTATYVN